MTNIMNEQPVFIGTMEDYINSADKVSFLWALPINYVDSEGVLCRYPEMAAKVISADPGLESCVRNAGNLKLSGLQRKKPATR